MTVEAVHNEVLDQKKTVRLHLKLYPSKAERRKKRKTNAGSTAVGAAIRHRVGSEIEQGSDTEVSRYAASEKRRKR